MTFIAEETSCFEAWDNSFSLLGMNSGDEAEMKMPSVINR